MSRTEPQSRARSVEIHNGVSGIGRGVYLPLFAAISLILFACAPVGIGAWKEDLTDAVDSYAATGGIDGAPLELSDPPDCRSARETAEQRGRICIAWSDTTTFKSGVLISARLIGTDEEWRFAAAPRQGGWVITGAQPSKELRRGR
jgi:hypothetical protein